MADRSSRAKKNKFSLEGLKEAREGGVSRLDQLELEDEGDVYEMVDEDQYASIVERRRNEDDFVVDDNGLGYHDDGEEHLGVAEDAYDAKKRLKEAARDGDNRLSKKARQLAESSQGPKNSILRHMQAAGPGSSHRGAPTNKKESMQTELDIDSLLGAGPAGPSSTTTSSTTGVHKPLRGPFAQPPRAALGSRPPVRALPPRPATDYTATSTSNTTNNSATHYTSDDQDFGADYSDAYAGAGDDRTENLASGAYTPEVASPSGMVVQEEDTTTATTAHLESSQPKLSLTKSTKKLVKSEPVNNNSQKTASSAWGYKPDLSGTTSAFDAEPGSGASNPLSDVGSTASISTSGASASKVDPKMWLLHSQPSISGVSADEVTAGVKSEDSTAPNTQGEEYVNMFYLDAAENNGVIYLFGKLPINENGVSNGGVGDVLKGEAPRKFVSVCVAVHGNERNLFVLPRALPDTFKEDGTPERVGMTEVYKELNSILVPSVMPRTQGQSFRCKPVKRKYAFEHGDIPRYETDYLKVVYSATHGVPTTTQCSGGKTYERIFGSTSSALELFLLKRKLMGPCWVTIRRPKLNSSVVSWCKVELAVQSPKDVVRVVNSVSTSTSGVSGGTTTASGGINVTLADCGAAPFLTSLSLSMKTVVNPVTHLHEIVMLSGIVHSRIDTEADSEFVNGVHQSRFTYIRQLGVSCGATYPATFPHDTRKVCSTHRIHAVTNERELLSLFFSRIQLEDPDVIVSHNLLGFEADVLLARAVANKLPNWSLLGRLRRSKPPKSINDGGSNSGASGRILCDTYKAAKEFVRETTYSLTHLAYTQLKAERVEVDPIDVPKYFSSTNDIMQLASCNLKDAMLVQGLMLKLQVIPLTKQLTNLSGNLWSRTIRGARAERIEYLLLHEFHTLKYVLPEKKAFEGGKKNAPANEDDDEPTGNNKIGGNSRKRAKAGYAGGLVLEPKKGLYDTYILLLDFNSLYPSIIQEYNLCFTTIEWTKFDEGNAASGGTGAAAGSNGGSAVASKKALPEPSSDNEDSDNENANTANNSSNATNTHKLAPLPDTNSSAGVLPRVIKTLVDRRRVVKNLHKKETNPVLKQQLDIRQKALKLTANSMYGCLGFSFSRFYARPIAALVTAMGREALQRTVDYATTQMQLDVIYGDTDSVMINTNLTDLASVKEIGNLVKKEVNKLYRSLELDLDGIFKSMLLLKKKKYAALVINEHANGTISYDKEMKGLDLVRRDWCGVSKDTGTFVVEQILSGKPREEIVMTIHDYLTDLSTRIRAGAVPLDQFVVTKGLNKNPKDYPDCKGQAHLQVALQMLKANKPVNIGDHIPYVICTQGPEGSAAAQRAYHPDDVTRAQPGEYTLDYEWYLSTQILPPISRLCEPIEGTSPAILSERLGLDATKYARASGHSDDLLEEGWGFTPKCMMDDSERFGGCLALTAVCSACGEECEVKSVQQLGEGSNSMKCHYCGSQYYGRMSVADCYSYLSNRVTVLVRACMRRYYECWLVCDDPSCGRRTMQQSVKGFACTENCHGRMVQEYDELALHTQLKCLEALFDVPRLQNKRKLNDIALRSVLPQEQIELLRLLRQHMVNSVEQSAYNWIRPSLWTSLFGKSAALASGEVIGSKL